MSLDTISAGYTRRSFLKTSGAVAGALTLGARLLEASELGDKSADAFLDTTQINEQHLKMLAGQALAAAKEAGASYTDVRFMLRHRLVVGMFVTGVPKPELGSTVTYGIRTIVNGAMAFEYGSVPTVDAVVAAAKKSVTQAKGFAKLNVEKTEFASAPVVTGSWSSPYEIDPFTVPIAEQANTVGSLMSLANRIEGGKNVVTSTWERDTVVCATSEGSLITQVFRRGSQGGGISARWFSGVGFSMPAFSQQNIGYEQISKPDVPERLLEFGEFIKSLAMYPTRRLDVGRYPVVMDGETVGSLLIRSMAPALQMDRVAGMEAEGVGTSYLSPPEEILGKQLFSSHLSLSASRPASDPSGAKWDDECVETKETKLMQDGKVIGYMTDRQTAPLVSAQPGGFAVSAGGNSPVVIGFGRLSMSPAKSQTSLEDLYKDVNRGVLMLRSGFLTMDQQVASGMMDSGWNTMFEIRNGKISSRVRGAALQFKTAALWKGIVGTGSSNTVGLSYAYMTKGHPWKLIPATATAPAAAFSSADVISIGE